MAEISIGTGGTYKSATAEGRAVEVLYHLQLLERNPLKNPQSRSFVTGSLNTRTGVYSGSFTIPVAESYFTDGSLRIRAQPYLTGSEVSPGGDEPTFKSTTAEEYALEVLSYLQSLERNSNLNTSGRNAITSTYNQDTGLMTGTFTFNCDLSTDADDGLAKFTAQEYIQLPQD